MRILIAVALAAILSACAGETSLPGFAHDKGPLTQFQAAGDWNGWALIQQGKKLRDHNGCCDPCNPCNPCPTMEEQLLRLKEQNAILREVCEDETQAPQAPRVILGSPSIQGFPVVWPQAKDDDG